MAKMHKTTEDREVVVLKDMSSFSMPIIYKVIALKLKMRLNVIHISTKFSEFTCCCPLNEILVFNSIISIIARWCAIHL